MDALYGDPLKDAGLKAELDRALQRRSAQARQLLAVYGVPLVNGAPTVGD